MTDSETLRQAAENELWRMLGRLLRIGGGGLVHPFMANGRAAIVSRHLSPLIKRGHITPRLMRVAVVHVLIYHRLECSRIRRQVSARMDIVSKARRSAMMAGIQGKDTKPELCVRQVAHALGFRFRLGRRDLSGSPDLVFPRLKAVIFVHGCYWHRHVGCRYAYNPKSNVEFWKTKFQRNQERDLRALANLAKQGWNALVIWECETHDPRTLQARIAEYLMGNACNDD